MASAGTPLIKGNVFDSNLWNADTITSFIIVPIQITGLTPPVVSMTTHAAQFAFLPLALRTSQVAPSQHSSPLLYKSEAPSTSTSQDLIAHHYQHQHQHQEAQAQHLPHQHHLYAQQEENHNDNDNDDEGDVFAYGPPLTSEHPPQPHQHQHQQDMSPHQHLSAAQLHSLAAASLSILTDAPPPSPPPSGPNSYSMRPISVRSGILIPQRTNPTLVLSYAHITAHEYLQVVLLTTSNSNNSPVMSTGQLKRVSSDSNASTLELGSQDVTSIAPPI